MFIGWAAGKVPAISKSQPNCIGNPIALGNAPNDMCIFRSTTTFRLTGSVQEKRFCLSLTAEKAVLCVSTSLEAKTESSNKDKDNRNI